MMLKAINIMMGFGKAISASIGADITKERLKILAIPSDVAPKSVGNMLGWESCTAAKLVVMQKRQNPSSIGEFASVRKRMMIKPKSACKTEKAMRVVLGFKTVIKYAVRKMAGTSVDIIISAFISNSPGMCFN